MNDDELRTQLRRELDSAPAWPLDPDDAARRADPHPRRRAALTVLSVVIAVGVTAASVFVLASLGRHPHGLGATTSAGPTVSLPPSPEASPAPAARFTCDGSSTMPGAITVAAQRDGVHVVVDNTSGEGMGFEYPLGGTNAPPGTHELKGPAGGTGFPLAPGDYAVKCLPNSASDPDTIPGATLHVVDPDGVWVPDELQCRSGQEFGYNADFGPGGGESLDEAVHDLLDGYAMQGDVIVQVGYPESASPEFALTRDARRIVIAKPTRLSNDRWLPSEGTGCSGEDRTKDGFHAPIRDR